jgi:hypothetical protein
MDLFAPMHLLLLLFFSFILVVLPFWKIFSRAGFTGWLSLALLIPIINIIALYYLAFAEWPRDQARSADAQ